MRLREETLWHDAPQWYGTTSGAAGEADGGAVDPPAGFVTYEPHVPAEMLRVPEITRGAVPLHHIRLIDLQLRQLRYASPSDDL